MIFSAEVVASKLFDEGYQAGKRDAQQDTITDIIRHRIATASKMAQWDSWSQGYIKGFDDNVS